MKNIKKLMRVTKFVYVAVFGVILPLIGILAFIMAFFCEDAIQAIRYMGSSLCLVPICLHIVLKEKYGYGKLYRLYDLVLWAFMGVGMLITGAANIVLAIDYNDFSISRLITGIVCILLSVLDAWTCVELIRAEAMMGGDGDGRKEDFRH